MWEGGRWETVSNPLKKSNMYLVLKKWHQTVVPADTDYGFVASHTLATPYSFQPHMAVFFSAARSYLR